MARITRAFADAARRCREGGLDGVEVITSSHILGQFLSPLSNSRSDDYGSSLENRARFLFEVLEAVREAVGEEFIVSLRFNADESNENGLSAEEGVAIARMVGRHGAVDILNVNGAYGGTDMGLTEYMPGMAFPAAPYVELARRVREASGMPTFQAARIPDPATADWAIAQGYLDMAGMTRPHMADPEIVAKLERGEEARIRPCVGAGYCLDRIYAGRDALCQHNVSTGREALLPHHIEPASDTRRAVVVGGGPAGMEAARVLALRGHAVTLFEAAPRLGGQILLAARGAWRKDVIGIADWLAAEIDHLQVDVRLNRFAETDDVTALEPDVVIVATGGLPETSLPRGGGELALTVWDVLGGQAKATGEVLIYDAVGAHAALSLADALAADGQPLIFATPDRHLGRAIGGQNVPMYLRNLAHAGTRVVPDCALVGIRRDGNRLVASFRHAYTREIGEEIADTVIADLGTASSTELFDNLAPEARNLGEVDHEALVALQPQPADANPDGRFALFRVGDALAPRDIHAALLDANRLSRAI
jgi:NADPH-dependent 2,4-dienoyl-CoA reductase/sulfur reductase-like enzyme